jgi:uncharacterized transporter YbjL
MSLEWKTVNRVLTAVSILAFAIAILGAIGEFLGWWNAVGEILITSGAVIGALTGLASLVGGQQTVAAIHRTVENNNGLLEESSQKLDRLETLDDVQYELDRQTGVLEQIRDRM